MYCTDDELDNLMDISIEIESNKVMKADFIDPWTVTLRDHGQSVEYNKQRDYSYRSSIFCLTILWIFVLLSEIIQIPNHINQMEKDPSFKFGMTMTLTTTIIFIIFLLFQLFLVIAQYSKSIPSVVREISEKFSNCHSIRKFVITFTVFIMVFSCVLSSVDIVQMVRHHHQPSSNSSSNTSSTGEEHPDENISHSIQYLSYIWIVSIISLSTFIKVHYLYKAVMLTIIFLVYTTLIVTFIGLSPTYYSLLFRNESDYCELNNLISFGK